MIAEVFGKATLYEILGVASQASNESIKKAFHRLALRLHPDKGGNNTSFQALAKVYTILSDPVKRDKYDRDGIVDIDDSSSPFDWNEIIACKYTSAFTNALEKCVGYKNSKKERISILKSFKRHHGDIDLVGADLLLWDGIDEAGINEKARLIRIIDVAIKNAEVQRFPKYEAFRNSFVASNPLLASQPADDVQARKRKRETVHNLKIGYNSKYFHIDWY
jgi:curved DNA-binding protein CbpA